MSARVSGPLIFQEQFPSVRNVGLERSDDCSGSVSKLRGPRESRPNAAYTKVCGVSIILNRLHDKSLSDGKHPEGKARGHDRPHGSMDQQRYIDADADS